MSNPGLPIWPLCDRGLRGILRSDAQANGNRIDRGTPEVVARLHDALLPVWKDKMCSGAVSLAWQY